MKKVRRSKKYLGVKTLSEVEFRRLTGVKRQTFLEMVKILKSEERGKKGGPRNKLGIEDRLLMALEYLREYRTYFHLSQSYDLSESAGYRTCRWVEDTLIGSGKYSLPGRKALLKSETEYAVVLVDATESAIERPKKSKAREESSSSE